MLIFYREMVTNGDPEQVMPIVQELAALGKKHGVPLNIWSGSNGHVFGTMGVSVRYESLSARAAAGAKLYADKQFLAATRRLQEVMIGAPGPDMINNIIRGGEGNQEIPLGTVVTQNQFQLANSGDFLKALTHLNELADLVKKLVGIDPMIGHTMYGPLGGLGTLSAYANFAQVDEVVAKLLVSDEYMTKFLEGGKYALPGSSMQRQVVKIA